MKRVSIVLSLILCLVLCAFAFASCSKKNKVANTTADGTDVPAASTPSGTGTPSGDETTGSPSVTVPVHVHTPGAYEVVKPATCSDVGEEAQFCTECGEKILESVRPLPTVADAHVVEKWDITPASMFSDGLQTGHCTACGQDLEKVLTWEPDITVIDTDSGGTFYRGKANVVFDVLDGDHFYPTDVDPDGKDLLVEYSILMNPSYENFKAGTNGSDSPFANTRIANADGAGYADSVVWMSMRSNMPESFCQYIGGFESIAYGQINAGDTVTPPGMCGSGTYSDYPNVLGADQANPEWGWHRIGVRIHEEVTNLDAVKTGEDPIYKMSASTYVDGVLVSTLYEINPANPEKLYTVGTDGEGNLVYTDISEDRYVYAFRIQETAANDTVYLVLCDFYMTCGTDFVQKITKVAAPSAATLEVAEGVEIAAPVYYTIVCDEHVWDGNFAVSEAATLLSDGTKVEHCSVCGCEHEVAYAYVPEVMKSGTAINGTYDGPKYSVVEEVLNGDHFYPTAEEPDGKDLLIEFSILWNGSVLNFKKGTNGTDSPYANVRIGNAGGSDYNNLTWQALTGEMPEAYGQYSGGYESGDLGTIPAGDTVTPAGMCGGDGAYSAYPNIGGADQANPEYGWHRIGFRVHQEVTNADAVKGGAAATYKVTITAYFDGVKAFALSGSVKAQNLLYTATSDGEGGITYADGASDRYVYAFRIQEIAANDDVYIPIGEVSVTCGTEFVQKVEKVASPAAKDYEVEAGVILPGAFYYRLAD